MHSIYERTCNGCTISEFLIQIKNILGLYEGYRPFFMKHITFKLICLHLNIILIKNCLTGLMDYAFTI